MKNFIRNKGAGQQGFTLIELLVVIAILAVLATIAIPAYSRFFGAGSVEANAAELTHVQAAMDAMMANHRLMAVEPDSKVGLVGVTPGFRSLPKLNGCNNACIGPPSVVPGEGVIEPLFPEFMRLEFTRCEYSWIDNGRVSQTSCP